MYATELLEALEVVLKVMGGLTMLMLVVLVTRVIMFFGKRKEKE